MAKKKPNQSKEPAAPTELEQRVDAMMSVEQPAANAAEPAAPTVGADLPTAPQLPAKLLKTISASKTTKPKSTKAAAPAAAIEPSVPDDPPPERILKLHIDETAELPAAGPTDEEQAAPAPDLPTGDPLADDQTDEAVDDITAHEADLQLAVDDARARRRNAELEGQNREGVLHAFFTSPWTWLFIIGIAGVTWAWFH